MSEAASPAPFAGTQGDATLAVREQALPPEVMRQRDLPVFDPTETERAVGFVRLVRRLVALPMTTLGVLALFAALAVGHVWFALISGAVTVLVLVSLWDDTRLTKSLELVRRGNLEAAQQGLLRVASSTRRFGPQRQRAYAYLAAIAWRQVDHAAALRWIQARRRLLGRTGMSSAADETWRTAMSEVWLLALLGHATEAKAALEHLERAPAADEARLVEITARLLVAFACDDAERVRPHLAQWRRICEGHDRLGLASAALAWAYDACGQRDAANTLAQWIRTHLRLDGLQAHAPRLYRWLEHHPDPFSYTRG